MARPSQRRQGESTCLEEEDYYVDDASQESVLLFPVARVDVGRHAVTVTVFVPHGPGTNGEVLSTGRNINGIVL